jgi:hypothetical protein
LRSLWDRSSTSRTLPGCAGAMEHVDEPKLEEEGIGRTKTRTVGKILIVSRHRTANGSRDAKVNTTRLFVTMDRIRLPVNVRRWRTVSYGHAWPIYSHVPAILLHSIYHSIVTSSCYDCTPIFYTYSWGSHHFSITPLATASRICVVRYQMVAALTLTAAKSRFTATRDRQTLPR